jgi:arsenate reductase-like glutaredoxin family protein
MFQVLSGNPKLIERPIMEFEKSAIVVGPHELMEELFSQYGK